MMKSFLEELVPFQRQQQESRQQRRQGFGLLKVHEVHPISVAQNTCLDAPFSLAMHACLL